MHQTVVSEVPALARIFMFAPLFCYCDVFIFSVKSIICNEFAIPFEMLFSLVYIIYCKICDKSSKVLIAEVKVIYFAHVWPYFRFKTK